MARYAYADPPYIGCAHLYPEKEEVHHPTLVQNLCDNYDGWALSCSSPSLQQILAMCPTDVRVMAWVKPFAIFKPNVNPAYAWEPVIVWHPRMKRSRTEPTVRDWVSEVITLKKGLTGAKPRAFCHWILDVLGWVPGDTMADLFPGTGIMGDVVRDRTNDFQLMERMR
jgi:hypothetical protein